MLSSMDQRITPVGDENHQEYSFCIFAAMKEQELLRAILPEVIIDNFDVVRFEKSDNTFNIWLDEKKVQLCEDKYSHDVISHGFGDYRRIQDYPLRGRAAVFGHDVHCLRSVS